MTKLFKGIPTTIRDIAVGVDAANAVFRGLPVSERARRGASRRA